MIVQNGETYQSSKYGKGLYVSDAKAGKTSFLVASALGVLPWQKMGGIVSRPEELFIFAFDASALGGLAKFLTQTCGAPKEALRYNVFNFQDDTRRVTQNPGDYNMDIFNGVVEAIDRVGNAQGGSKTLLMSSLTGLAAAMERSIIGPPKGKGYADPSKWKALSHQLNEIRNLAQVDEWHCLWEGHLDKPPSMSIGNSGTGDVPKESINVSGSAGRNWGYNVEQVFRLRRTFGQKAPGSNCDVVYLDTKPALDFISNGRGFNELLEAKEYDLTAVCQKLGLKVGHWGAKAPAVKAQPAQVQRPVGTPVRAVSRQITR